MDFLSALSIARKERVGLRPKKWRKQFRDRSGRECDLRAYTLLLTSRGAELRLMNGTFHKPGMYGLRPVISVAEYLGDWEVITEPELAQAYAKKWARPQTTTKKTKKKAKAKKK